jgi:diguanylate cyclase
MTDAASSGSSRTAAGATMPAPLGGVPHTPAQLAKAALVRLAQARLEPTPENYLRAYRAESGEPAGEPPPAPAARRLLERMAAQLAGTAPGLLEAVQHGQWDQAERALARAGQAAAAPSAMSSAQPAAAAESTPQAQAWASLIARLVKGVERGGRQWTSARKKDSLQRVLAGSRSDPTQLLQRLGQLAGSWETDTVDDPAMQGDPLLAEALQAAGPMTAPAELGPAMLPPHAPVAAVHPGSAEAAEAVEDRLPATWQMVVAELADAIAQAMPDNDPRCLRLKSRLDELLEPLADQADEDLATDWRGWAGDAQRLLEHRQHLVDQLQGLCGELSGSLADLAEDGSWVQGQCTAIRDRLEEGLTARTVRTVSHMLHATRSRQQEIKAERTQARDVLKQLINNMLERIGALGDETGRYRDSMGRYAGEIAKADSLESLAGVVKQLVEETQSVQSAVTRTQAQLQAEHDQASELQARVRELEAELQRLSTEVSTDQLTEIANRRGLIQAFDTEHARMQRSGGELSVGLLDIDNFKKLNDSLGHQTGDQALKFLANSVKQALRPMDTVARYGGEEFVVLLPQTNTEEAKTVLSRLQRTLTASFFMHENKQVFVTFSAGVTLFRAGERLEETLDRADEALYEAKRTGKNRTCVA